MNENYVTSLELSKQLREAGIEQKSEFYWHKKCGTGIITLVGYCDNDVKCGCEYYSAFLNDELLAMLPMEYLAITFYDDEYCVGRGFNFKDKSLPNALAKMLLYLKKENLF